MFCGCVGHLDEFCFWRKRIERRHFDYTRNSYRDEFPDFLPRSFFRALPRTSSHALPQFAHMVLIHERTALSLGALVTPHILIIVIVSREGLVFLLDGLTLTLSRDT
jgi:hypothetical protein